MKSGQARTSLAAARAGISLAEAAGGSTQFTRISAARRDTMKKLAILLAGVALLTSSVAFAKVQGIMAMPTLRKQILTSAKQDGSWNGQRPSLRLEYAKNGKTVKAAIYTLTSFNGTPHPMSTPQRLLQATATFKVAQTSEGKLATPVKVYGQTWQHLLRAIAR
jgi:hypothetical protein